MSLAAGTRLGPYEILSALGAGGMGEVYKARDTRLERTVAIKVLSAQLADDPQFRDRFDREARAVSALDHPNICALYDVGKVPSPELPGTSHEPPATIRFLVMQYLEGETLEKRLAGSGLSSAPSCTANPRRSLRVSRSRRRFSKRSSVDVSRRIPTIGGNPRGT